MQKPYICPKCGARFSGPFIRCIGADGKHRPTIVRPLGRREGGMNEFAGTHFV